MKRVQMLLLALWTTTAAASTQGDPGWWALSTHGSHQIRAPGLSAIALFSDHSNAVAADETGTIFEVGFQGAVSPFGLYRLDGVPTTTTWSFTSLSLFPNTNWGYIAVDRKRVWMLRTNGDLVWFDKTTPNQTPNFVVNMSTLGIVLPPPLIPALQCTNGRELSDSG